MSYRMTIPVMHCFNDKYSAPAAVAFLSMLEHAAKDCFFKLYVLHSDITEDHQKMLHDVVSRFPNASLDFMHPDIDIIGIWAKVKSHCHYSADLIYKLVAPNVFPQHSRLMVPDVDVLYCDDISQDFVSFASDDNLMAGHRALKMKWLAGFGKQYFGDFSEEEYSKIEMGVNACYMIYNLDAMRREEIVKKAIDYFIENAWRIRQPEQDTMNIVCAGRITYLPLRTVICTYFWRVLEDDEKPAWKDAMEHPVQLHFPGPNKPWVDPGSVKSDLWWGYLARTPFFYEVASQFSLTPRKSNWSIFGKVPFLEIFSRGEVSDVRLGRFLKLRQAVPFWRKNCC